MIARAIITPHTVRNHITAHHDGVAPTNTWGEEAYFYNPGAEFKRGTYFATVKIRDGPNDKASQLDRPGLWRLNIGVGQETYRRLFGPPPPRPAKGETIQGCWRFDQEDRLLPHPVYAWMSWICVLNPSQETWPTCVELIADAHTRARHAYEKRLKQRR